MALATTTGPSQLITAEQLPIDRHPAAVYLAGLSANSRRTMLQSLNMIAKYLIGIPDAFSVAWQDLRYQHVAALRSKLQEAYSPASTNKMLCALRGTLREAWRLNLIPEEAYRRTVDIKGVRGETLPAGRALAMGELQALLDTCSKDGSILGIRDAALIALLYACGLRRAEICALDLEDFNSEELTLRVVRGKGNKDRIVPVANGAAAALQDWIQLRGEESGALFVRLGRENQVSMKRLSSQAIYNCLQRWAKKAGVADFSPHDLRRTMISDLLDLGADLVVVSKLAGHASVTTTARYDRRGDEAKREAVDLLHVPYRRNGK